MNLIDKGEAAGSDSAPSEDRCGVAGNIAWVIDGASDFGNERNLPAISNVHWLVDKVQDAFRRYGSQYRFSSADRLLHAVQCEIADEISQCDLNDMRQHPCCSLALVVDDEMCQVSRIGDAAGFLFGPSRFLELSTDFFDRREAEAVATAKAEALSADEVTMAMYQRREEYIHGISGESVFSGHPSANLFIHTFITKKRGADERVLLTTDGLTRAVTEYRLFSGWRSLVEACEKHGILQVINDVRAYERECANKVSGKFKKSDDIAALLLTV